MEIASYDRSQWEAVLSAFRHFLSNRTEYSRKHKQAADTAIQSRQAAIEVNRTEYRKLNLHKHSAGYTNIPLPMLNGKPRPERTVNLRTHASGIPIEWRVFVLPECDNPDNIVRYKKEDSVQPEHIRLQLEIMQAAA